MIRFVVEFVAVVAVDVVAAAAAARKISYSYVGISFESLWVEGSLDTIDR